MVGREHLEKGVFMNTFLELLYTLTLTIIIEYAIIQLIVRKRFVLGQVALVNLVTNPAINLIFRYMYSYTALSDSSIWNIISILEVVVVFVEGALYKYLFKTKWSHGLIISLIANWLAYLISFLL